MKLCLVVDDSRVIRRVAAKIVQDLGFDVEEADDGRKALNACAIRMPDVVLIDSEMPDLGGVETVKALRKMPGGDKVVVVFCATENEPAFIREALAGGGNEYIMKPFDSEIVRSKFLLLDLLG
ncbi:MAG: response regulator [Rhodospirillaceae bacterium]|nr:response regulator [Rhodospirillaceae bacterium]